ncbi:MAG: NAD+ synthase [Zoogloeaceae bacterium]|jgi:NAD+ synthetase|nr:NAD+ synthase [Zoogloeaceae bacterium]
MASPGPLRIALAQIDSAVGDFAGNVRRIAACAERARAAGARLLVTPEMALCGYPPEDLLLRPDFHRAGAQALDDLASLTHLAGRAAGLAILVGHTEECGGERYNAASLLRGGGIAATYRKQRLPNCGVFDEQRYFTAGDRPCVVEIDGVRCGINICANVWEPGTADAARRAGADLLLALNASPYRIGKLALRHETLRERIRATGMPMLYVNRVGGQDELVFDGASFALDGNGCLTHQSPPFAEALEIVEYAAGALRPGHVASAQSLEAEVYGALTLGVRDYLGKNGFPGAIIGLSGGIDSALALTIAVDALGAGKVRAVMLPSPYTAQISLDDARALARTLGVRYDEIPIAPAMRVFDDMLAPQFAGRAADATEENLQARIRGLILMALSNKTDALVLTTGNKSEMAVGYTTLYGDMAGGFAVLKDVYKTLVYRLSRYRNEIAPVIPERIITRPPSAELRPEQTDQDTLPPYETLDAIIEAHVEHDLSPREIAALGHDARTVRRVIALLKRSEYKRRQAPVGIRITKRGFGKDWRYPITSNYADEEPPQ